MEFEENPETVREAKNFAQDADDSTAVRRALDATPTSTAADRVRRMALGGELARLESVENPEAAREAMGVTDGDSRFSISEEAARSLLRTNNTAANRVYNTRIGKAIQQGRANDYFDSLPPNWDSATESESDLQFLLVREY